MRSQILQLIHKLLRLTGLHRASRSRRESNRWLHTHCASINGAVLSIGSGDDSDGEGEFYRSYFKNCTAYTTSEVTADFPCDLVLDVRAMPEIADGTYDCVFSSGVLEHVDNFHKALREITRILKPGGILLLGLPFRQALHMPPHDFWRFTEFGVRELLSSNYEILELKAVDATPPDFPAAYWTKARRRC